MNFTCLGIDFCFGACHSLKIRKYDGECRYGRLPLIDSVGLTWLPVRVATMLPSTTAPTATSWTSPSTRRAVLRCWGCFPWAASTVPWVTMGRTTNPYPFWQRKCRFKAPQRCKCGKGMDIKHTNTYTLDAYKCTIQMHTNAQYKCIQMHIFLRI